MINIAVSCCLPDPNHVLDPNGWQILLSHPELLARLVA
jgi:hypothetical protein